MKGFFALASVVVLLAATSVADAHGGFIRSRGHGHHHGHGLVSSFGHCGVGVSSFGHCGVNSFAVCQPFIPTVVVQSYVPVVQQASYAYQQPFVQTFAQPCVQTFAQPVCHSSFISSSHCVSSFGHGVHRSNFPFVGRSNFPFVGRSNFPFVGRSSLAARALGLAGRGAFIGVRGFRR